MAETPKYDPRVLQEQREFNKAATELVSILKEQQAAQKEQLEAMQASKQEQAEINRLTSAGVRLGNRIARFSRTELQSKAKRKAFEKDQIDLQQAQLDLAEEIDSLYASGNEQLQSRAKNLQAQYETNEQILRQARKLSAEYEGLTKSSAGFEFLEGLVGGIPIVRDFFSEFKNARQVAADYYEKTGDIGKAKWAGRAQVAVGGLKVIMTALVAGIIKGLVGINESITKVTTGLQVTQKQAEKITGTLRGLESVKMTIDDLTEATIGLSDALGTASVGTTDTIRTAFTLTKRLGMSADEAANLLKFSASSGDSLQNAAASAIGLTSALNNANGSNIRFSDILRDISAASSATLLSTQKFPGGITKAAFEARKLGLSLSSVKSAGGSLLNFQESISSELEVELLTGKQLNLQKAREAALMDDQATLANEIAKNVGSAAEFGKMNVLQQQAVAKAVGLEREEVAQSLMQREALLALEKEAGVAGLSRLSSEEQIRKLTEANMKAGMSQVEARQKALMDLGKQELARIERTQTAQEDMANSMSLLGGKIADLITGLTGVSDPLKLLVDPIVNIAEYLGRYVTGQEGGMFADALFQEMKDQKTVEEAIANATAEDMKALGVSTRKELADILKVANFKQGSIGMVGALPELNSDYLRYGFTTTNKNIRDAREKIAQSGVNFYDDFTIRANPKDSLVMAGGTRFGEETNSLLKELISEVKASNNIYLDSRRVNSVLAMNAINQ
jgi:hypothetical protein